MQSSDQNWEDAGLNQAMSHAHSPRNCSSCLVIFWQVEAAGLVLTIAPPKLLPHRPTPGKVWTTRALPSGTEKGEVPVHTHPLHHVYQANAYNGLYQQKQGT
jgi:hypothetical protein